MLLKHSAWEELSDKSELRENFCSERHHGKSMRRQGKKRQGRKDLQSTNPKEANIYTKECPNATKEQTEQPT